MPSDEEIVRRVQKLESQVGSLSKNVAYNTHAITDFQAEQFTEKIVRALLICLGARCKAVLKWLAAMLPVVAASLLAWKEIWSVIVDIFGNG